jgi:hypothetical protein
MPGVSIDIKASFQKLVDALKVGDKLQDRLNKINQTTINVHANTSSGAFDHAWASNVTSDTRRNLSDRGYTLSRTPVNQPEIDKWRQQHGEGDKAGALGAAMQNAVGLGLGLWGGFTVLGIAKQAWEMYKRQEQLESGLKVRGYNFERSVSPWGYGPGEEAQSAMHLLRTTGANDMSTLRSIEKFSRLSNIDPSQATGYLGSYYNNTGADATKQKQAVDALIYMGKQAKDGRSEALLGLISRNLDTARSAQGGKALTDGQVAAVMANTTGLYNMGPMGRDTAMYNTLQSALMPGGSQVSEIMKWKIMGGFDKGPLTSERMLGMYQQRDKGLLDPTNRARLAEITTGSTDDQVFKVLTFLDMQNKAGGVNIARAVLQIVKSGTNLGDPKTVKMLRAHLKAAGATNDDIDKIIGQATDTWQATDYGSQNGGIAQRAAINEGLYVTGGKFLEGPLGTIESGVLSGTNAIFDSLVGIKGFMSDAQQAKMAKYSPFIEEAARKYGISPQLIMATMLTENESLDPNAINRSSRSGAWGLGQILGSTGKELGYSEADLLNPKKNIDAIARYLGRSRFQFKGKYDREPTAADLRVGYRWGAGEWDTRANKSEYSQDLNRFGKFYAGTGVASRQEAINRSIPNYTTPATHETGNFAEGYLWLGKEILSILRGIYDRMDSGSGSITFPESRVSLK